MFGVTADETGQESSQLLDDFVLLQKEIFSSLKLHFRLYSMYSHYILINFRVQQILIRFILID